uniref:Uncharacterized protein n=1 Tax=Rhizophagus irregularis (strain DAOM 181602 / DAOM 197198 / MUCL 43194) TaxID=747089 RepID=U9TQR3_RHIID
MVNGNVDPITGSPIYCLQESDDTLWYRIWTRRKRERARVREQSARRKGRKENWKKERVKDKGKRGIKPDSATLPHMIEAQL